MQLYVLPYDNDGGNKKKILMWSSCKKYVLIYCMFIEEDKRSRKIIFQMFRGDHQGYEKNNRVRVGKENKPKRDDFAHFVEDDDRFMRDTLRHRFTNLKETYGDLYYWPQDNGSALKDVQQFPFDMEELELLEYPNHRTEYIDKYLFSLSLNMNRENQVGIFTGSITHITEFASRNNRSFQNQSLNLQKSYLFEYLKRNKSPQCVKIVYFSYVDFWMIYEWHNTG